MANRRRLASEFLGTAGLLTAIVGSGLAADGMAEGAALTLLVHSLVVGLALVALILALGPWSAHFNPAVTLALWRWGAVKGRDVAPMILAQVVGAVIGVILAHVMFEEPWLTAGTKARAGAALFVSEVIATFGLLLVVRGCARRSAESVAFAVGAYITAAIWFTSSDAFANPAVAIARCFTDSWCAIAAGDVPAFVAAQLLGV